MFKFIIDRDYDERVNFANDMCKLLIQKNNESLNINEYVSELKNLYDHFFENVRNIYQFVDSRIPLFALYELEKTDNLVDLIIREYEISFDDAKLQIIKACKEFYLNNTNI